MRRRTRPGDPDDQQDLHQYEIAEPQFPAQPVAVVRPIPVSLSRKVWIVILIAQRL